MGATVIGVRCENDMSIADRLGVHAHDLHSDTKRALQQAGKLGVRLVELATQTSDMLPAALSKSGRRHLLRIIEGLGLQLNSLTADHAMLRLTDPTTIDRRIELTRDVLLLAADLHVSVVSTAIGAVTHPETSSPSPVAVEALQRMGEAADTYGIRLALRPASDDPDACAALMAAVGCPAVQLGLDLASLVMAGNNPIRYVERFAKDVAIVHVRDARMGRSDRPGCEVRMGDGDVDLTGTLVTLESTEYRGAYILRRTGTNDPLSDLMAARQLLQEFHV